MTKILRHFSANEEVLDNFPFKRELSMEAYLIENPKILGLDNDTFSGENINIIQEELSIKQGRKSKETDGRIDILISYSEGYYGVVELKLGTLNEIHLEQLEDYLQKNEDISKIIKETYEEKNELDTHKFIGILVGTGIDPKLADKISNGYKTKTNNIPISAVTLNGYRSGRGDVYITSDVYFKQTGKDYTKYDFEGEKYGKSGLVLAVVRKHVEKNPKITFADLIKDFPNDIQGTKGVFTTYQVASEIYTKTGYKRHFLNPEDKIKLSDCEIAICTQWGTRNIDKFIKTAEKLSYRIKTAK